MNIKINGADFSINDSVNIVEMLDIYGIKDFTYTAIEYNNEILKKQFWDSTILKENDKIEIVSFVGGG